MPQFTLKNAQKQTQFKGIMQLVKEVNSYILLKFMEHHVYIQIMNPAKTCICEVKLCNNWFDEFIKMDDETNDMEFVFSSTVFYTILNTVGLDQLIQITFEEKLDKYTVAIQYNDNDKINKYYSIPLMGGELEIELLNLNQNINYTLEFSLESSIMRNLIKEFGYFTMDTLKIEYTKTAEEDVDLEYEVIEMFCEEAEKGTMNVQLKISELEHCNIDSDCNQIKMSYGLAYIAKYCLSDKISKYIQFSIKKDTPMRIQYGLDNQQENIYIDADANTNANANANTDVGLLKNENYINMYISPKIDTIEED